jgi:hypothetical protein
MAETPDEILRALADPERLATDSDAAVVERRASSISGRQHSCHGRVLASGDMGKKQTLRFGAGSPEAPCSSVWCVATHMAKPDVYLGTRESMRIAKVSLHDREWRYAYTSQSGAVSPGSGSRVEVRWLPQGNFAPGWTQGPTVLVPHLDDFVTFPALDPDTRSTVRLPGPSRGHMLGFTILLADRAAKGRLPVQRTDHRIGGIPFSKGTIWVFAREVAMPDDLYAKVVEIRGTTRIELVDDSTVRQAAAHLPWTDAFGRPTIVEVLLGPSNVVEAPSPDTEAA